MTDANRPATNSLAGYILAHGRLDPDPKDNNLRVMVVLAVLLSTMVLATVLAIG